MDNINDLTQVLDKPTSVTVDGQTVTMPDVRSRLDALKFLMATRARRRPYFGMSVAKIVPHGSVFNGDEQVNQPTDGIRSPLGL